MLLFGFEPGADLGLIVARAENHCFAKLKLRGEGGSLVAKLMTHKGRLSTLEFSKPPESALAGSHEVLSAELAVGGEGYAEHIDSEEHGKGRDG